MKRIWISMITAGLLAIAAFAPASAQDIVSIELGEVEDSGMGATASLSSADGGTSVSITVTQGAEEGAVHPVHIHEGSCEDLGDVVYPLEDIEDGASESTVEASMADLMTGEYAINAHLSEDEIDVHVMCGDIPEAEIAVADNGAEDEDDAAEDEDGAAEDETATEDDTGDEEVDEVPPATGSNGAGTETAMLVMTVLAGAALTAGMLLRRRVFKF